MATSAGSVSTPPPKAKKQKRLQKYRQEWETDHSWLSSTNDSYKANCKLCHRTFTISHGGLCDVKQHAAGDHHIRNARGQRTQAGISSFLVAEGSSDADLVRMLICYGFSMIII